MSVDDGDLADLGAGGGFESVLTSTATKGLAAVLPGKALRRTGMALIREPQEAVAHLRRWAMGQAAIAYGVTEVAPALDRRFADPTWTANPLMKRIALSYLLSCETAMSILDDANIDWRTREKMRLFVDNLNAALAPTNTFAGNPAAWKAAVETGGMSLVRGLGQFLGDQARSGSGLPQQVDHSAFEVGKNLATAPGKVVRRTRTFELLQYTPTTDEVDEIPVVLVASPVNKYYLLDLDERTSVIRTELAMGRQVFVASWVNPDERHADLGFDLYVRSITEMLETATQISGTTKAHLLGLCGGGQLALLAAGYLAGAGRESLLASLTLGIAVTDFTSGNSSMAFMERDSARKSVKKAAKKGYITADSTRTSFALIRPIDGIWTNVVNNYLLGMAPPAFNLLYWASDQTNMSLQFAIDTTDLAIDNGLSTPGKVTVLDVGIDLRKITVPTYVLGASTDHICPWHDCYRTLDQIGDNAFFVLGAGGHAAMISKPAGAKRSTYWLNPECPPDPDSWLDAATPHEGSWWEHWNEWITELTPHKVPAPQQLGSAEYPPIDDAPGVYVRKRVVD